MKYGFIKSRNFKLFIIGTAGAGKAHLLAMMMGENPPTLRHSVQYLKHLIRVTRIGRYGNDLGKRNDSEISDTVRMSSIQPQSQEAKVESAPNQLSVHSASLKYPIVSNIENDLLLQEIENASDSEDNLEFDCVDVIDIYIGRPDFLEVLPNYLDKATGILLVLNLSKEFSQHQIVENYNDKSELVSTYQSVFTNEEMMRRTLESQVLKTSDNRHRDIAIIGTHKDQEHKSETREEKNVKLQNMLPPGLQDNIFYYGGELRNIIFPVNAKEPGPEEKEITNNLCEVFVEKQNFIPDEIPLRWYGLHLALQKLVQDLARGILSKAECLGIASRFHLGERSTEAALKYLHSLKFLYYYDAILPQVIFADPHIPLVKQVELFEYSQKLREAKSTLISTTGRLVKFREHGILTTELLSDFPHHYTPGLFTPSEMIRLFIAQLVVAEVQSDHYFMPSLLPVAVHAKRQQRFSSSPLLLYFPDGRLPTGLFCALVCCLISYSKWKLLMQSGTPVHQVFRNRITFEVPGETPSRVTLSDSLSSYFEVSCPCEEILRQIRWDILVGIRKTFRLLGYVNINPQEGFLCPVQDQTCSHSPHPALIDGNSSSLNCTINPGNVVSTLQQKHKVWLEKSQMLGEWLMNYPQDFIILWP